MRFARSLILAAIATATLAVAPGVAQEPGAAVRDEIAAFYREWSQAAMKSPEGYAASFSEDALLLPPEEKPVAGRVAIREWQERSRREARFRLEPQGITVD